MCERSFAKNIFGPVKDFAVGVAPAVGQRRQVKKSSGLPTKPSSNNGAHWHAGGNITMTEAEGGGREAKEAATTASTRVVPVTYGAKASLITLPIASRHARCS